MLEFSALRMNLVNGLVHEVFGTSPVGNRSVSFRATLQGLADI
jgi:hypothetical protein